MQRALTSSAAAADISMPLLDGTVNVGAGELRMDADDAPRDSVLDLAPEVTMLLNGACSTQLENACRSAVCERDRQLKASRRRSSHGVSCPTCKWLNDPVIALAGCWATVKEYSLLTSDVVRHVSMVVPVSAEPGVITLLTADQVADAGASIARRLCVVKHNGACEKLRDGFTALSAHVLRQPAAALHRLPSRWLDFLLSHLSRAGQRRRVNASAPASAPRHAIDPWPLAP